MPKVMNADMVKPDHPRTRCQGFWMPTKCPSPRSAGGTYGLPSWRGNTASARSAGAPSGTVLASVLLSGRRANSSAGDPALAIGESLPPVARGRPMEQWSGRRRTPDAPLAFGGARRPPYGASQVRAYVGPGTAKPGLASMSTSFGMIGGSPGR